MPCTTLDELLQNGSYGTPTLVKIDAEGVEVEILHGGWRLSSETNATFIVEFTDAQMLETARHLLPERTFEPLSARHWLIRKDS